jgi:hypothetical protein
MKIGFLDKYLRAAVPGRCGFGGNGKVVALRSLGRCGGIPEYLG